MWRITAFCLLGLIVGVLAEWLVIDSTYNLSDAPDAIQSKAEWACLQAAEDGDSRKGKAASSIEFVTFQGYELLYVPSGVWIMLRLSSAPFYKQMPSNSGYSLSPDDYQKIETSHKASRTVLACLQSHVN